MFSSCRVTVTMLHVCRLFVRTNQQSSQCRLLSLNRKKRHRKSTCVCFMTHYTYTSFFFILCSDQFVIINMPNVYLSFITYLGTMYLIYKHESLTDPGKEENLACFVSITKIKVKQAKDMFRPFYLQAAKKGNIKAHPFFWIAADDDLSLPFWMTTPTAAKPTTASNVLTIAKYGAKVA